MMLIPQDHGLLSPKVNGFQKKRGDFYRFKKKKGKIDKCIYGLFWAKVKQLYKKAFELGTRAHACNHGYIFEINPEINHGPSIRLY
jgi:hypothetical protein